MAPRRSTRPPSETNKKRRRTKAIPANTGILPLDITLDILSRLPIQSLRRFRCVSKSWNKLFKGPFFTNLHKEYNRPKEKLLLIDDKFRHYIMDYKESDKLVRIASPPFATPEKDGHHSSTVGSCDGVFCVEYFTKPMSRKLYLWNPTTGKYKKIPCLKTLPKYGDESNYFYYNHNTNDYEILSISMLPNWSHLHGLKYGSTVAIYSLRKNSWRALPDIPYEIICLRTSRGELVNGFIHWAAKVYFNGVDFSLTLIAFEIGGEKFRELPLPHDNNAGLSYRIYVTRYREKLCVIHLRMDGWDMWVMNEYGLSESWRKLYEIKCSWQFPNCLTTNGLLLMREDNGQGVLYDPEMKSNYHRIPYIIVDAGLYSESLVDLKGFRR